MRRVTTPVTLISVFNWNCLKEKGKHYLSITAQQPPRKVNLLWLAKTVPEISQRILNGQFGDSHMYFIVNANILRKK